MTSVTDFFQTEAWSSDRANCTGPNARLSRVAIICRYRLFRYNDLADLSD